MVQQNHIKWKRFQLIDWLKIRSCDLIERQTKLVKYLSKLIKWQYLLVIGYMWCIIGYILLNMVQSQFTKHMPGKYRTRTFIPEERERTGGYLAFFLQMIWLILIAIDLMFFLFQRLQKQNLRSLPLIGGKVLILSFNIFQKWASRCEKVGSVMLASESEVGQTW